MSGTFGVVVAAIHAAQIIQAASLHVVFDRQGYRLTSIGDKVSVAARVVDAQNRPVPSAPIRWRIADPAIADVTPQGVVTSRKVGLTKLWAVAGADSSSILIKVDQWSANFGFAPSALRFDALGTRTPLKVELRDATGHVVTGQERGGATCRSLNARVASLAPSGEVVATGNGFTWIRCADRGIADSVRVEVRQQAVRAQIVDRTVSKTQGDTFRLRVRAFDRGGQEIRDIRATWASSPSEILDLDPLSGFARARNPGSTKVLAQVGDASDSISVSVGAAANRLSLSAGSGDAPTDSATKKDTLPKAVAIKPQLRLISSALTEGGTGQLTVTAHDDKNDSIPLKSLSLVIRDTMIASLGDSLKLNAKKFGTTWLVGTLGTLKDSTELKVYSVTGANAAPGSAQNVVFRDPHLAFGDTLKTLQDYRKQRADSLQAITTSVVGGQPSNTFVGLTFAGAYGSHTSNPADSLIEARDGYQVGAHLDLRWRFLHASGEYRNGTFNPAKGTIAEILTVTDIDGGLRIALLDPWIAVDGGYSIRVEDMKTATQSWQFARAGVLSRFPLAGGTFRTVIGFQFLPLATFSGRPQDRNANKANPLTSYAGEAGVEARVSFFTLGLTYYVERFTFDEIPETRDQVTNAVTKIRLPGRVDQFSSLRFTVGLRSR